MQKESAAVPPISPEQFKPARAASEVEQLKATVLTLTETVSLAADALKAHQERIGALEAYVAKQDELSAAHGQALGVLANYAQALMVVTSALIANLGDGTIEREVIRDAALASLPGPDREGALQAVEVLVGNADTAVAVDALKPTLN